LRSAGPNARPATYREIASRLALSEHTVRNALDALREQLLMIGIPGMIGPEAKDNLARYAVRSGSITPDDLHLLD
jgi:DNA-binding Lrp family transcriptional regulator